MKMTKLKSRCLMHCWVIVPAAALLLAGCGQKEEPAAPSAQNQKSSDTAASLQKAASDMKDTVQQTAQDVAQKAGAEADKLKTQAQQQVQQAKDLVVSEADKLKANVQDQFQAAKEQTAATSEKIKAQSLIDRASKLVVDTQYADAANVLKQVA